MARFTDYATTRQERLWVVDESPFNTLAQPGPHHQVILIPGTTLPPVLFAYTPSEERRPTPDIADLIQRKKTPSSWVMPVYAKFGSAQGRPPSWSLMAEKAFGQMVITWTIVDHTLLTGKTVTVRIDGTDTVLTEGAEWSAATSNPATATSLAAAINALAGVGASAGAVLTSVVTITRDAGTSKISAITNALATGMTGQIVYSLLSNIEETSFSIWHLAGNMLRGLRGCLTDQITLDLSGSAEGKIEFRGFALNEVFAGPANLAGGSGETPTAPTTALAGAGAGLLSNGVYKYKVAFVHGTDGEGPLGVASAGTTVVDATSDGKIAVSAIPIGGAGVTARNLYRTVHDGTVYKFLATVADNTTTTYSDNIADGSLGATSTGTITATATAISVAAGTARRLQVGPNAADFLIVQVNGHTEKMKVLAVRYSTGGTDQRDFTVCAGSTPPTFADQLLVERGYGSTTPEAYVGGEELQPFIPAISSETLDSIAGVAQGEIDFGEVGAVRGVSITAILNNQEEVRLDEYGVGEGTGYRRRGARTVSGRFLAYQKQDGMALRTNLQRHFPEALSVKAGVSPARLTATIPISHMQTFANPSGGPEFQDQYEYQGLASAAGNDGLQWVIA